MLSRIKFVPSSYLNYVFLEEFEWGNYFYMSSEQLHPYFQFQEYRDMTEIIHIEK